MSQRSSPPSRVVRRVRRTVRSSLRTIGSLTRVSHRSDDRGRDTATRLESRADPNADPLDPDTGPTSRGEILEYGWLPSEYVRAVLTDHGGRIKQRRFVDEYGWSPSTLSELLTSLEDDGAIERYRLGREKVVRLPDEEHRLAPVAGRGNENGTR